MPSNPFATRYIRAGSLPFQFAAGTSLDSFHSALAHAHWRGQIVGPHGSGKSTFLHHLADCWGKWDRVPLTLPIRHRRVVLPPLTDWTQRTQIIIDGYEQLPRWRRWLLLHLSRRRRCGLLVTCHRSLLPPTLLETSTDLSLARQLVDQLTQSTPRVSDTQLQTAFAKTDGNLRETFLSLYDVYAESGSQSEDGSASA